jgi:predicted glycosyltransferase
MNPGTVPVLQETGKYPAPGRRSIWIDLDNSPHVPFFAPIIEELEKQGYSIELTARDAFQVCELADLYQMRYRRIGRHYGKSRVMKVVGTCLRAFQLAPIFVFRKPRLALSHGSRAQVVLSRLLGVPSIVVVDYEFARHMPFFKPEWIMIAGPISETAVACDRDHVLKYPGIKEDVYVPSFRPDPRIVAELNLSEQDLVVTVRPPANEAHYHNPESEKLFAETIEFLCEHPETRVVLLPRNERQGESIQRTWPEHFASCKIRIPQHAVDGLNLIWHSEFVISGGGTMNREAAALGVPVYSIFRGKTGAVDRYLEESGRLTMVRSAEEVRRKVVIRRRTRCPEGLGGKSQALAKIVDNVISVIQASAKL